jgi:hypothetical protein
MKEPEAFKATVDALELWFKENVPRDLRGRVERLDPGIIRLRMELGIHWIMPTNEQPVSHTTCTEEAAEVLLALCDVEPAAWDLCRLVASHHLRHSQPIPKAVATFAALALDGIIKEPKRPRRSVNWLERLACLLMIELATRQAGLTRTRSDATGDKGPGYSACDAVSEALRRVSHGKSYRALKEMCVSAADRELRSDIQHVFDAILAMHQAAPAFAAAIGAYDLVWLRLPACAVTDGQR